MDIVVGNGHAVTRVQIQCAFSYCAWKYYASN